MRWHCWRYSLLDRCGFSPDLYNIVRHMPLKPKSTLAAEMDCFCYRWVVTDWKLSLGRLNQNSFVRTVLASDTSKWWSDFILTWHAETEYRASLGPWTENFVRQKAFWKNVLTVLFTSPFMHVCVAVTTENDEERVAGATWGFLPTHRATGRRMHTWGMSHALLGWPVLRASGHIRLQCRLVGQPSQALSWEHLLAEQQEVIAEAQCSVYVLNPLHETLFFSWTQFGLCTRQRPWVSSGRRTSTHAPLVALDSNAKKVSEDGTFVKAYSLSFVIIDTAAHVLFCVLENTHSMSV